MNCKIKSVFDGCDKLTVFPEKFVLKVTFQKHKKYTFFKVDFKVTMGTVFEDFQSRHGVSDLKYKFKGRVVKPDDTIVSLGMTGNSAEIVCDFPMDY